MFARNRASRASTAASKARIGEAWNLLHLPSESSNGRSGSVGREMDMDEPADTHELPIHWVETVETTGAVRTQLTVDCPLQQRTVSLDECMLCPGGRGMAIHPTPGGGPGDAEVRLLCMTGTEIPSNPAEPCVGDAMTRDVMCVRSDVLAADLAGLMLARNVSGVPVVDSHGRAIGVVSLLDLMRHRGAGLRVADLMTPHVVSLPEGTPLAEAATLMASRGIHRILVLASDRRVLGVLTLRDLLRWRSRLI
jgi:hypothetical protein